MYRLSEVSNLDKPKKVYKIDHRLYLPNSVLAGTRKRSSTTLKAFTTIQARKGGRLDDVSQYLKDE